MMDQTYFLMMARIQLIQGLEYKNMLPPSGSSLPPAINYGPLRQMVDAYSPENIVTITTLLLQVASSIPTHEANNVFENIISKEMYKTLVLTVVRMLSLCHNCWRPAYWKKGTKTSPTVFIPDKKRAKVCTCGLYYDLLGGMTFGFGGQYPPGNKKQKRGSDSEDSYSSGSSSSRNSVNSMGSSNSSFFGSGSSGYTLHAESPSPVTADHKGKTPVTTETLNLESLNLLENDSTSDTNSPSPSPISKKKGKGRPRARVSLNGGSEKITSRPTESFKTEANPAFDSDSNLLTGTVESLTDNPSISVENPPEPEELKKSKPSNRKVSLKVAPDAGGVQAGQQTPKPRESKATPRIKSEANDSFLNGGIQLEMGNVKSKAGKNTKSTKHETTSMSPNESTILEDNAKNLTKPSVGLTSTDETLDGITDSFQHMRMGSSSLQERADDDESTCCGSVYCADTFEWEKHILSTEDYARLKPEHVKVVEPNFRINPLHLQKQRWGVLLTKRGKRQYYENVKSPGGYMGSIVANGSVAEIKIVDTETEEGSRFVASLRR
ncbi:hypothetical protein BCR33DRAFT_721183 [Rhizoclosmatium globosum]|uniref:Uncharacterized protein n=1 Tax=Rhizoclosmatium globosum TaxID=329046 RepID=A0A1Y2BTB2_9FUNG|nr:hypothetical protein BCR33DRAFT_721183 [Rhizoclosmatium globosum]|eukprot:ORY37998.1 hypothetical protein BCR33DRAFT_721183 [Rhizoclosmatium globosum]